MDITVDNCVDLEGRTHCMVPKIQALLYVVSGTPGTKLGSGVCTFHVKHRLGHGGAVSPARGGAK